MLSNREEQDLRDRVGDLVLNWQSEQRGSLESVESIGYLDFIEASSIVNHESNLSLHRWVNAARREELSWEQIGSTLGISRQAAQKRFRSDSATEPPLTVGLIERRGVSAFNEVVVLQEEGLLGRKVVRAGWGKLYFAQTDEPRKNARVVSLRRGKPVSEMEAEGWSHMFSWYPYTYYSRVTTE